MQRVTFFLAAIAISLSLSGCQTPSRVGAEGVGKYPYGKPVPNEEGLVYSPYSTSEVYIDVRGFERGTEVKDPWTGKIFLVP